MSYFYIKKTEEPNSFFDLMTLDEIRQGVKKGTILTNWLATPVPGEISFLNFTKEYPQAQWTSIDLLLKQYESTNSGFGIFGKRWTKNIVNDENVPVYYSERAIYLFSAFFNTLFGAILLAYNLRHTESKKGVLGVITFGFIFTAFQILILSMIPKSVHTGSVPAFIFGMIGSKIMLHFFWNRFIGKDTKHRAKSIWMPLIVGLVILAAVVIFIVVYATAKKPGQ